MKSLFILAFLFFSCTSLFAQRDSSAIAMNRGNNLISADISILVKIYPVPVKEGRFTIESDMEIAAVKITNIIGQEIYKSVLSNPEKEVKINIGNAVRGMYVIMITLSDNTRIVKKISSEGPAF